MTTWEYLTVKLRMDPRTGEPEAYDFAVLGADGWELAGVAETVRVGNTLFVYLWFKRPKAD